MLIGICGAKCAGKATVAQYLIDHHGFKKLHLEDETSADTEVEAQQHKTSTSSGNSKDNTSLSIQISPSASRQSSSLSSRPGRSPQYSFSTVSAMLDYVTKHWRSRWVTTDIHDEIVLDALSRRPFFILLSVDAPLTVRWRRFQQRQQDSTPSSSSTPCPTPISLESFVDSSDTHLYDPHTGVLPLMSRAAVRLLNTSSDLAHLYATLGKLDLTNPDRLRPSWDSYFMQLASLAAQRCNCMKRAVGCVLVDGKRTVISTGYNGTPRHLLNCGDGGCPRCNSGDSASGVALGTCLCLHAEENALLEAGRERIREGSVLYCNTCPCLTCSIKIVQVGISEVVYNQGYSMDRETAEVFRTGGVRLRQFSPPANGLIHLERLELY